MSFLLPTQFPTLDGENNIDLWEYKEELEVALCECNTDKELFRSWYETIYKK